MRPYLAICCLFLTGCAHSQLRWNTTHQARTLTDIYEQQVLDNLAMFVHDPGSLPFFAFPNQGGADVIDRGSAGSTTSWNIRGFNSQSLMVGGSRDMKEAWTMTPVHDVRRLELMRCAYLHALASAGICSEAQICPDCVLIQKRFYKGSPKAKFTDDSDTLEAFTMQTGITTPACFSPGNWLAYGEKKLIPKRCEKVGHYWGTYVWLLPGGQDELTKLTFTILDYAFNTPPEAPIPKKEVTVYYDKHGSRVSDQKNTAIEVRRTVPADTPFADIADLKLQILRSEIPGFDQIKDFNQIQKLLNAIEEPREANAPSGITIQVEPEIFQNALNRAREEFRIRQLTEGAGESLQLAPIQPPGTGLVNPLQYELYRDTLTPTPR